MSYKPKKRNKHLLEKKIKKIFFRFFLPAVVIFVSSVFLFNAHFLAVKNISFVNTKNIDKSFLEGVIREAMEGKYFGLYNKNNFIFYPETKVENAIKSQEKRVKSVDISYSGFSGNIEIDIEEKKPVYLYCVGKKEKCYFAEFDGKIFTEFSQKETGIPKKDFLILTEKPKDKKIPERFLEEEDFQKVIALVAELETLPIKIQKIEKRDFGEIILKTKNNTKIIINTEQDFSKIPKTLKKVSIKKDLKINKIKKDFPKDLKYINLSYGESVFYCVAGELCQNNY